MTRKVTTWKFSDRSKWNPGPWDKENIDKKVWVDPETGLDCMIHRNRMGSWCGYVGVPSSHEYFGTDYNKLQHLDAHGGLTFSSGCTSMDESGEGICHPADDGDHVWWLGFDCAHSFDACPRDYVQSYGDFCEYRNIEYVEKQVSALAKQLS